MADATGETKEPLRVAFDRRLKLEFHGARITSDAGLLAYRELDDALGLTAMAASVLTEGRHGTNIRHRLLGLLRQAVYGRLAGYGDVNDAQRLARDPAMRAIVGREGLDRYVVFQLAEVAVPRALFAAILRRIDRLRGPPVAVARRRERATGQAEPRGDHAPKIDQSGTGGGPWARLRRLSRPRSRSRAGASAGRGHPM